MTTPRPDFGQLWTVNGDAAHAIYLGHGLWNILVREHDEYTLTQVTGLEPVTLHPDQPAGHHWADQFDALAAAAGLNISWAEEISSYRARGLAKLPVLRKLATA